MNKLKNYDFVVSYGTTDFYTFFLFEIGEIYTLNHLLKVVEESLPPGLKETQNVTWIKVYKLAI